MNVLFLTKYSQMGASSRYRSFIYQPYLESNGVACTTQSLFGDQYLQSLYNGKRSFSILIKAFWNRFITLASQKKFDLIVLEKEAFPYIFFSLDRLLSRFKIPYIVDYDDAIFHLYGNHRNPMIRRLLRNKIAAVMRSATTVIAGNDYLAAYAQKAGAKEISTIPTVIDLSRYPSRGARRRVNEVFTIGWIGSPTTTRYLLDIAPALRKICKSGQAKLHLVGAEKIKLPGIDIERIEWNEETEVEEMHRFDVGLMPLPNEPWAKGKCGFKLIQYMACGLPVIGSPVGVNTHIVDVGINGYLPNSIDEWVDALELLRNNNELREVLGRNGRLRVEEEFCLEITAPKYLRTLQNAIDFSKFGSRNEHL